MCDGALVVWLTVSMLLTLWKKDGKMLLNRKKVLLKMVKNIPKVVEDCIKNYPNLTRPEIRKLVRTTNKITSRSDLTKLDRYLKKRFKNKVEVVSTDPTLNPSAKALEHSLALTEGLKEIVRNLKNNESWKNNSPLHALAHLSSGYPDVYAQMVKLETACETRQRQHDVVDFLLSNEQVSATEKQELRACRHADPDGFKLIYETRFDLIGQLSNAIAMVEVGRQPLKGHCSFCPNSTP